MADRTYFSPRRRREGAVTVFSVKAPVIFLLIDEGVIP